MKAGRPGAPESPERPTGATSTAMEVRIWGETPARFRQLFRAVKFHRLICTIHESAGQSYTLRLDGPLSLFSSTQKYGLQLALFLPALLHCKAFDLKASVRWGTERKEKLSANICNSGGVYVPQSGACDRSPSVAESVNSFSFRSAPQRTFAFRSNALQWSSAGRNSASCRPYFCVEENSDSGPSSRSVYD